MRRPRGRPRIDLRDQRCDGGVGAATDLGQPRGRRHWGERGRPRDRARPGRERCSPQEPRQRDAGPGGIWRPAHPAITLGHRDDRAPATGAGWDDHIPPRVRVTGTPSQAALLPHGDAAGVPGRTRSPSRRRRSRDRRCDGLGVTPQACPEPPATTPTPTVTTPPPAQTPPGATDLVLAAAPNGWSSRTCTRPRARAAVGVADTRLAGQKVEFVFSSTGKVVAAALVGTDGRSPHPRRCRLAKLRRSSATRYQARVGTERSINLKLVRRMIVTSVRVAGGKVTIAGASSRRSRPSRGSEDHPPARAGLLEAREGRHLQAEGQNGSLLGDRPGAAGQRAAVYRMTTKVRVTARSKTLAPTFTLPRAVQFG